MLKCCDLHSQASCLKTVHLIDLSQMGGLSEVLTFINTYFAVNLFVQTLVQKQNLFCCMRSLYSTHNYDVPQPHIPIFRASSNLRIITRMIV